MHTPLSEAHLVDPLETDEWLRTNEPVAHVPERDCWLDTSHELVAEAIMDTERFSNRFGRIMRGRQRRTPEARAVLEQGWPPRDTLFTVDPPLHRSHRLIVQKTFSAKRVNGLEPTIRSLTTSLVDAIPRTETVDIFPVLAVPLPMTVIADQLGVPRTDLPLFKRWSDAFATELSGLIEDTSDQLRLTRLEVEFQQYFHERIVERRAEARDDVLSDLVYAEDEDGNTFDDAEILSFLTQLLVAGNETTTSAIAAGVRMLAGDPDLQARVRADRSTIPALVEEVLRLESPIQAMWRVTTTDAELGGVTIPEGSYVLLRYLAANHDPAHYDLPEHCRVDRDKPRDHLAFGAGIHFCVGAALARSEVRVATEELLDRTEWIDAAWEAEPGHPPSLLVRQLDRVPVVLR
ncbi:MAG TPA: cytochrome P450 [Acidimicrobiia bacterium]|nr:cytochrome P450 [Acidimicrobiia bacterium]